MKIAVTDDRSEDREELLALLERYCAGRQLRAEFRCFDSAEALLSAFRPGAFEILFIDIYLGGASGMEAARRIRAADPDCCLIFFTTSSVHAVESYDVRAGYYLTKPLDEGRVTQAMDVVCAALLRSHRYVHFRTGHVQARLLLQDILYADCADERPRLHLADRVILAEERVTDVFPQLLQDERFLSCNRNIVVNMDYISGVREEDFLLKNGAAVPIRQKGRLAVKQEFLRYSLKTLRREKP